MPVLRGRSVVRRAAAALREGFARKYAVLVDGRPYPPKELLEAVLGHDPGRRPGLPAPRLEAPAGCVSLGGDARRDAEALP